jgi:hypothetical protein
VTLLEFEIELRLAQKALDSCMDAFLGTPVEGLGGPARREAYDRLREAENGVRVALDEVQCEILKQAAVPA